MRDEQVARSHEVSQALAAGNAVVALESTVIAQGLPWPANLETAHDMMNAVRGAGAVPATIAVLDGTIRIGLDDVELAMVAHVAAPRDEPRPVAPSGNENGWVRRDLSKANRRDLAAIIAGGRSAATTVSATLWIARRFSLAPLVMATGGLGGVHRQASDTFDISTDLDELARADGALVVCSGVKSILDVPATLEALETRAVLVVGYRTNELPGFLTRSSGLTLEHRLDTPEAVAALVRAHRELALPGAIVLAQPVPTEKSLDAHSLELALGAGLKDASARRITGKPLTPFLLESIRQATAGESLQANCALLVENARLAAEVAAVLINSNVR